MTVQTTNTEVQFQGDGSTTSFPFGFQALQKGHIDVFLINTNPSSTVQGIAAGSVKKLNPSDFSVTLNSNSPGGTVNITGVPAPTSDITVSLQRNTPVTQQTNYVPNDPFPAESHERALDKLTLIVQELQEDIQNGGFISAAAGEDPECPPLPPASVRADKLLGFNSAGCPTLFDAGNFDIIAPQTLGELANVNTTGVSDGQVIEFNSVSGEWEPSRNVSTINDVSGDVTISTNSDGDIVLDGTDSGGGSTTTTVVNSEDIGGGSRLLQTFTAAENGSLGDFLALRSNKEVERIKTSDTGGNELLTEQFASGPDRETVRQFFIEDKDVFVTVLYDQTNANIEFFLFTIDRTNFTIKNKGSLTTVVNFSSTNINVINRAISAVYDESDERFVLGIRDPDNNFNLRLDVVEPDFANLGVAATNNNQSPGLTFGGDVVNVTGGYNKAGASSIFVVEDDGNSEFVGFGVTVDPSNNSVSVGSKTILSLTANFSEDRANYMPYAPDAGVNVFTHKRLDLSTDTLELITLSSSGTSVTENSFVSSQDGQPTAPYPIVNTRDNIGILIFEESSKDEDIVAKTFNLSGTVSLGSRQQLIPKEDKEIGGLSPNAHFGWAGNIWFIGVADSDETGAGNALIAYFGGDYDPSTGTVGIFDGVSTVNDADDFKIVLSTTDADTQDVFGLVDDTKSNLLVATFDNAANDKNFVNLHEKKQIITNSNRWVGVSTEDFSAGDTVTVALRGSEVEVNATGLSISKPYSLTDEGGLVQTNDSGVLAGLATDTNRLLTTDISGSLTSDGTSGNTQAGTTEEIIESRDVTAATNEIVVGLDDAFRRITVEVVELQYDVAAPAQNLSIQLSTDGGSTFVSSNDYRYNQVTTSHDLSEPRVDAGDNTDKFRFRIGTTADSDDTAWHEVHVWNHAESSFQTKIRTEGTAGDDEFERLTGRLKVPAKHTALRIFSEDANVKIARAIVRVRGIR